MSVEQYREYARIFQSTRPARGATLILDLVLCVLHHFNPRAPRGARRRKTAHSLRPFKISIHAPREGRDYYASKAALDADKFQSTRPARGATNLALLLIKMRRIFQSTRPARGATFYDATRSFRITFQSTRPARGATGFRHYVSGTSLFQSTRPARGATCLEEMVLMLPLFQSTRPARGATFEEVKKQWLSFDFNPRAPRGARPYRSM